jgi:hypothetical protein
MEIVELQEKARSLGIKRVTGISKKQLQQSIAQVEANIKVSTESDAPKDDANTVVVLDKGNQEIRRYTRELHGENFIDLAKAFANAREYKVQFKKVKPGIPCPSCGYIVHPEGE